MKRFLCFVSAAAFSLVCLLLVGIVISSNKTFSYADESFSSIDSVDPVGLYQFDSIGLLSDGDFSVAAVGDEWDGQVLTDCFATVVVKGDGSLVCSGAVHGEAFWAFDETGAFTATGALDEGRISVSGVNASGLLFLEVLQEDGSCLTLCFAR